VTEAGPRDDADPVAARANAATTTDDRASLTLASLAPHSMRRASVTFPDTGPGIPIRQRPGCEHRTASVRSRAIPHRWPMPWSYRLSRGGGLRLAAVCFAPRASWFDLRGEPDHDTERENNRSDHLCRARIGGKRRCRASAKTRQQCNPHRCTAALHLGERRRMVSCDRARWVRRSSEEVCAIKSQ
jgi:hypothetical protein